MAKLYFKVESDWQEVVRLRNEIEKLEALLKSGGQAGTAELTNKLRDAKNQFRDLTDRAAANAAQMRDNATASSDVNRVLDALDSKISSVGKGIAGAFATDAIKDFVMQAANVRGQFQQLEASFKNLLGNKERADELMNQLIRTAATTPFQMSDVASSAKQLMSYGVSAENVNATLIKLGDIAAGLSIPIGDLAYLYGTTMTQGRLYTQDLNQFLGRGIPLVDELAKQFNVTKAEVKDLVKEGKVGFPQVEAAINSLTGEGGKFGGLMEAQSKTIAGQMSNIEDSIEQMYNEIGRANEETISDVIGFVGSFISHWKEIGKVVLSVAAAFGTYKAVLMVTAVQQKLVGAMGSVRAFLSLATSVRSAKDAMVLFNIACSANPLGLILSVLSAAASAFYLFGDSSDEATERSTKFGEATEKATSEVESLYGVLESADTTSKVYATTQDDLIKKATEYGLKIDEEKDKHQQLIEVKQELIQLMREEAVERERANMIDDAASSYSESLKAARNELAEALEGRGYDKNSAGLMHQLISEKDIEDYAERLKQVRALSGREGWSDANKDFQNYIDSLLTKVNHYTQALGKNKQEQYAAKQAMREYLKSAAEGKLVQLASVDATNKAAQAARNAESASNYLSDAERRRAEQARLSKMSVDQLSNHLRSIIETYNNSKIGVKIEYEEFNVPDWMKGFNSADSKKYAAWYASLFKQLTEKGKKGINIGGQYMTTHEVGVRAGQYSAQAKSAKVSEDDAAAKATEKREREAKDAKNAAKRAATEAARQREREARERKDAEKRLAEELKGMQKANTDSLIALEEDETQRKLKQLERDWQLRKEELEAQAKEWEELNLKTKGKKDLTPEQTTALNKAHSLNDKHLDQETKKVFDEQKSAEEAKQKDKIAEKVKTLKENLQLDKIFSEIDIINPEAAERAKQQLQEFIDTTKSLTPEDIKLLTDAMEKLQERIDFSNPIASIRNAREEIRSAKAEFDKYQRQYNKAKSAGDKDGMKKASAGMNNAQRKQNRARKQEEKSYKALTEVVNEYAEALSELGDKIGGTAGKMLSLAGNSVICITSMLQGIQAFQTGMSNLERAIAILAIIQAAIKAATILFDVFSSLFATENLEWERMSEQYKQLSSVYDDLIEKKKEFVSISYGKDVNEATAEIKKLYEAEIKGLDAVARARLTYRKRGEHSVGYNMWKGKGKHEGYAWKDIAGGVSEILGREFKGLGDLIGMTQEQWEELVKRYPEYVANLDADFLNYLNEIRGKEEAIKAAAEAQTEQWTGFTSESFVDYFIDGLMDMDKSAQEFAKDFESYLVNAIVKALVMENNKEALNNLLEMINKATEDGKVTEQEVNEITDKGGKLMEKMKQQQELALKGFGVYDELKQQEASAGGFETMSQETGEELNGRFTALNITADNIATKMDFMSASVGLLAEDINKGVQEVFSVLDESRSIQAKMYLELAQINERQGSWDKPMKQMFNDITDIKNGLKNL